MTDIILETERLRLRRIRLADDSFVLELLNEPSFLRYIGDKGVRTLADAREYILSGPRESYRRFGYGLYLTELKDDGPPIGVCGLLKRPNLEHADLGYALLPTFWSRGYALESAAATLAYGRAVLQLNPILAVTDPDNAASISLLNKLGMRFDRMLRLTEDGAATMLFVCDARAVGAEPAVSLRPATAADAARLAAFAADTFTEAFAADNHPEDIARHLGDNYGESLQRREIQDLGGDTLLAEVATELVGFAQLRSSPLPACVQGALPLEIQRFYVAAGWHGRGVAQALMSAVEAAARTRGARELWLGVWEQNLRAQAFYRKCGFATVGSHTFMLGSDPQVDCVMTRSIDGGATRTHQDAD